MHFFSLANRCLVLLFTLTVVSSMSNKICQNLRKQHEKIRVLGVADGGTLFIITTSGQLFKLKLNSTLRKDSTEGHYYINIGGKPTSHVSEEWPNVPLDLSENKNKLYALLFVQNSRKAILSSLFKTETGNWLNSLYSGECGLELEIGQSATKSTVAHFERCNSKTLNDKEDAFMVSRSPLYSSKNPMTFVKPKISNRYNCDGVNVNCINIANFLSDDTVLAASHLAEPYNILLFIYTSGFVEIRQVPTFPTTDAPSPNWTVPIGDFIQCEATQQEESTTTTTTDDVPGLWHTHTWRIVAVAVLLVLNGICLVLLYRKRYKKNKKEARKRKGKCYRVKKRKKKSPNRSPIGPIDSSVDNSITGTRRRAESSPTGSPIIRKNKKKVTKCPPSISKGSTAKGSTTKPIGSTLTIRTESGSPLTNKSNSKGSSTQKKPSSEIESTSPPATVSNPSNVNSKASAKLSLAKKKQATGKWITSFLWAKKRNKKRNDKKKPKDTKKDNEKK